MYKIIHRSRSSAHKNGHWSNRIKYNYIFRPPHLEFTGPTWDFVFVDIVAQVNHIDFREFIGEVTSLADGRCLGLFDDIAGGGACAIWLGYIWDFNWWLFTELNFTFGISLCLVLLECLQSTIKNIIYSAFLLICWNADGIHGFLGNSNVKFRGKFVETVNIVVAVVFLTTCHLVIGGFYCVGL